jgi:hypothetical protein
VRAGGAAGQRVPGKNMPGRPKTDKLDAQWLARLTELGLLRVRARPRRSGTCAITPGPGPGWSRNGPAASSGWNALKLRRNSSSSASSRASACSRPRPGSELPAPSVRRSRC